MSWYGHQKCESQLDNWQFREFWHPVTPALLWGFGLQRADIQGSKVNSENANETFARERFCCPLNPHWNLSSFRRSKFSLSWPCKEEEWVGVWDVLDCTRNSWSGSTGGGKSPKAPNFSSCCCSWPMGRTQPALSSLVLTKDIPWGFSLMLRNEHL